MKTCPMLVFPWGNSCKTQRALDSKRCTRSSTPALNGATLSIIFLCLEGTWSPAPTSSELFLHSNHIRAWVRACVQWLRDSKHYEVKISERLGQGWVPGRGFLWPHFCHVLESFGDCQNPLKSRRVGAKYRHRNTANLPQHVCDLVVPGTDEGLGRDPWGLGE